MRHIRTLSSCRRVAAVTYCVPHTKHLCKTALQGVQGISDIITIPGLVNVDFADVKAIMCNSGTAMLGVGVSSGRNRAEEAALVSGLHHSEGVQTKTCIAMLETGVTSGRNRAEEATLVKFVCGSPQTARLRHSTVHTYMPRLHVAPVTRCCAGLRAGCPAGIGTIS